MTITDPASKVTNLTYDAVTCNLASATNGEGDVTEFTYDGAGNVATVTEGFATADARTTSFVYDAMNRLTSVTDGEGGVTTFRYDAAGNLEEVESATGEVQFRDYDSMGRLTSVDDPVSGVTDYLYDLNGNLTSVTDAKSNLKTRGQPLDANGAGNTFRAVQTIVGSMLTGL